MRLRQQLTKGSPTPVGGHRAEPLHLHEIDGLQSVEVESSALPSGPIAPTTVKAGGLGRVLDNGGTVLVEERPWELGEGCGRMGAPFRVRGGPH